MSIAVSWPAWVPTAVAVALACLRLAAFDYHFALAVAPVSCVAASLMARSGLAQRRALGLDWVVLVAGPLAVAALVAAWQPSCGLADGAALWLLGPIAASLWGAAAGALAALAPKPSSQRLTLVGLMIGAAVPCAAHFLTSPQIDAYAPQVGHIAGALYEDAVAATWRDVAYRLADLGWILPLLAVVRLATRLDLPWSLGTVHLLLRSRGAVRWSAVVAVSAVGIAAHQAGPQRWRIAAHAYATPLPIRSVVADNGTVHVTIFGPRGPKWRQPLAQLQHDVAFRYQQLAKWFGHPITGVHLYAWPDAGTKRAWTGAHKVEMAKPWLRQIHMVLPEYGSTTLTHELAHVFAAVWADNPLGVPLKHGLVPDALTIEGMAVAAEWPLRAELDPHGWARAARQLGKAPSLDQLASPTGFLRLNPDLAYTLAGSLLRYIGQTCGRAALARAYAHGELAVGCPVPLPQVLLGWAAFVDDPKRAHLTPSDLERARARFEPPGLFDRPCALAVGRCSDRAAGQHLAGNDRAAADLWATLVQRLPIADWRALDPAVAAHWHIANASAGDAQTAAVALQNWLDSQQARPVSHRPNPLATASVLSVVGDLDWQSGQLLAAQLAWSKAQRAPLDEASQRTLEVKQALAQVPAAHRTLASVLCVGGAFEPPEPVLADLRQSLPTHPLATWLWARRMLRYGQSAPALAAIESALPAMRLAYPLVYREALRTVALAWARRGDCQKLSRVLRLVQPTSLQEELTQRCQVTLPSGANSADARLDAP